MKKMTILALVLVFVLTLTACSSKEAAPETTVAAETTAPVETTAPQPLELTSCWRNELESPTYHSWEPAPQSQHGPC